MYAAIITICLSPLSSLLIITSFWSNHHKRYVSSCSRVFFTHLWNFLSHYNSSMGSINPCNTNQTHGITVPTGCYCCQNFGTIIFLVLKCQDLWIKNTFDYMDFLLSHYLKSIHTTKMFRDVKWYSILYLIYFNCFGSVSVTKVCTEIRSYTLYIGCVLQVIMLKFQLQWKLLL